MRVITQFTSDAQLMQSRQRLGGVVRARCHRVWQLVRQLGVKAAPIFIS
jgi:hypothetical protein